MIPDPEDQTDLEPLNLGGAREMVSGLVQLIEAKALAERMAFRALVQELSAAAGPETAFRIQARLDVLRWDPDILSGKDNGLREEVARELSMYIDLLGDMMSVS